MKNWKLYTIITVVSVALFGLIYVQSEFIRRSIYIQEQFFNQFVQEAMLRVAVQVEENESYNFFNKTTDIIPSYNTVLSNESNKENYSLSFKDNVYTLEILKDDSIFHISASNFQEIENKIQELDLDLDLYANPEQLFDNQNFFYQNRLNFQVIYDDKEVEIVTDSSDLFSLLDYELKRVGISTPFNFSLLEEFTLKKYSGSSEKMNPKLFEKCYKETILLNSFFGTRALLLLEFPNKKKFLFKSNSELLVSSFIFILLIVASFVASWYIIFRQKKLSVLKNDFINNMTHELKTPVATISLATEMLNKEKVQAKKDKLNNYISIINEENKRLGNHIERVLQTAQLDKEAIKLNLEKINLHNLLQDLDNKFKLRIIDAEAKINWNLNAEKYIIKGDRVHLLNIFSNLMDNALKYRKEDKLIIDLNTYNKQNKIFVEIKDNGIGMTKADSKRIFEKFYRVPTGDIHNVKGFGLGLSYVKTMIEQHDAKVSIDSSIGKYTKFIIEFETTK